MEKLSAELQRTLESNEEDTLNLRERLESTRSVLGARVKELEEELDRVRRESESIVRGLEGEVRSKGRSLEESEGKLAQLKAYIGQVEEASRPAQVSLF